MSITVNTSGKVRHCQVT